LKRAVHRWEFLTDCESRDHYQDLDIVRFRRRAGRKNFLLDTVQQADGVEILSGTMWNWIASLPPSSASFLGTLTGSGLGLIALLIGALFNAHLNRRRDDRLRGNDAHAVTSAIKAELSGIRETLTHNADGLEKPEGGFLNPDIAHSVRVTPVLLQKLGLLDGETIREIIGIYVSIYQYCEGLIMMGGKMTDVSRPDRRVMTSASATLSRLLPSRPASSSWAISMTQR
jgi:hypothetical protein